MAGELLARDMIPRSEAVTAAHDVLAPRYPVIDAHNHLRIPHSDPSGYVGDLVRELDGVHVETVVNLSGGYGDQLTRSLDAYDRAYPGRFATFCSVDWSDVGTTGWADRTCAQMRRDVAAGARGLKVFKNLGLEHRDPSGHLVMPDDPRIADVWDQAGTLGVPVLIHSADPVAFFRPLDGSNERWDELQRHPDWHFNGGDYPTFDALLKALYRTIEAHPATTFITAHVGCYPENLAFVSEMLDRYPNLYTDISARFAELGRVPYSARRWFIRYADRILYGTDVTPGVAVYRNTYRFLETDDEYFNYSPGEGTPPQGRWRIYGLYLPDEVLQKVYRGNAARLLSL
ncbi:MAG: amidohydrolase family protein [Anaerolineae bacterium]